MAFFLINSSLLNDGKAKFKSGLQSLGSQPVLKRLEELYRSIQKWKLIDAYQAFNTIAPKRLRD